MDIKNKDETPIINKEVDYPEIEEPKNINIDEPENINIDKPENINIIQNQNSEKELNVLLN